MTWERKGGGAETEKQKDKDTQKERQRPRQRQAELQLPLVGLIPILASVFPSMIFSERSPHRARELQVCVSEHLFLTPHLSPCSHETAALLHDLCSPKILLCVRSADLSLAWVKQSP